MPWLLAVPGHQEARYWFCGVHRSLPSKRKHHDDIIKWKHFPRYWPFVWGIPRSPVNSPHKGQWHGALMFSLICAWIKGWVNKRKAGDLRCHCTHYDVSVMISANGPSQFWKKVMKSEDIMFPEITSVWQDKNTKGSHNWTHYAVVLVTRN